ncbi:MAG: prolyl oligopeptidase family serine peptidase [Sphingobacteriales bacterium]|nr:prolyl oligopeptidase family serine peptidase [Sphingobacteriales bacterium]OJY89335.1 MAG: hypothetical protein BGP14_05370 [Sphingobacteriales bacterium 44-15]
MRILFLLLSTFYSVPALSQKVPIGEETYNRWPIIDQTKIANDGSFIVYTVFENASSTLYIQATDGSWKKQMLGAGYNAVITEDSRRVIFMKGDSLCVFNVKQKGEGSTYLFGVSTFQLLKAQGKEWLVYRFKQWDSVLVVRDLKTNQKREYANVISYEVSSDGSTVVFHTSSQIDHHQLLLTNLKDGSTKPLWQGGNLSHISFDRTGRHIAFLETQVKEKTTDKLLWYIDKASGSISKLVDKRIILSADTIFLHDGALRFSADGRQIFFQVNASVQKFKKVLPPSVDVWSYRDSQLQSQQLLGAEADIRMAVIDVKKPDKVICLTEEFESIANYIEQLPDHSYVLTRKLPGDFYERSWNAAGQLSFYLVSTKDGSRKLVKENHRNFAISVSPDSRFFVYHDNPVQQYFSYNIASGQTTNITQRLPFPVYDDTGRDTYDPFFGIGGWSADGSSVFIYDQFDIWQVDMDGKKAPINITCNYGRANNIILRFNSIEPLIIKPGEKQLLSSFNLSTKDNGFFSLTKKGPEQLVMGPYVYYFNPYFGEKTTISSLAASAPVLKATDKPVYLLQRMSTTDYPNLYSTTDFRHFTQLTDFQPQRRYDWYTTELVHGKTKQGKPFDSVLYKPEGFNPNKKYPVIFYFYEQNSGCLNFFNKPGFAAGQMNIPTYVSSDYLVCVPDIHYTPGHAGQSALDYVTSIAEQLSQMPWVDAEKMGLQGHSFGGYEVNYIISQSNLFAAAVSAAGVSDFVSGYGSLSGSGYSHSSLYESGQNRLGGPPCENADLYIENSPVFFANKVQTPLLLMSNKEDGAVPWLQGVEFFTSLRRFHKKVWLLQYDKAGHQLVDEDDQKDYTVRMQQFFDYYLKDAPPPRWMTQGVPAKNKGYSSGFEPDFSGKQP